MRADDAEMTAEAVDTVQGLREILAFGAGPRTLRELDERATRHARLVVAHARRWATERAVAEVTT